MPEFKEQITTGNLIQIGAMLVAMGTGWAMLDASVSASAGRIDDHEARLRSVEAQMLTTLTRMDGRLGEIERALKR